MKLAFDLEANGLLKPTPETPVVSRIHCLVIKNLDTKEVLRFRPDEIASGARLLMEADLVIGHNIIGYDLIVLSIIFPWFSIEKSKVYDTLVVAKLLFPHIMTLDFERKACDKIEPSEIGKHRLKAWGQRLGTFKMDYTGGWAEFSEEMLEYNVGDVEVTEALYGHLQKFDLDPRAFELEHLAEFVTARQGLYGFPFDLEKAQKLTAQLQSRLADLEAELKQTFKPWFEPDGEVKRAPYDSTDSDKGKDPSLWKGWWGYRTNHREEQVIVKGVPQFYRDGRPKVKEKSDFVGYKFQNIKLIEFNPGSRHHIIKRLRALYDWKHVSTEVTPSGQAKIDEKILGRLPYPEAKLLAEYMTVQKRLGLLMGADEEKGWLNVYREERGCYRVFGEINTNGAVTGRGTHRIIANIPRVTSKYGPELRELLMASPGRYQVGIDVSGLELRMLAHFLAKFDYGSYGKIVCEGDVHSANAAALFDIPPQVFLDGREDERLLIECANEHKGSGAFLQGLSTGERKTVRVKAFYGKLRDMAKTFIYAFLYGGGDMKIGSIAFPLSTEAVQRREGKRLKATFVQKTPGLEKLLDNIKGAAVRGYLLALDGRKVHLRSDHSALNFLLQGAGSLLCKKWMVLLDEEIERRDWRDLVQQLIWYHDELQFDVDPSLITKGDEGKFTSEFGEVAVATIAKAGEYFGIRVPLTGEYKVGRNWRECH